MNTKTRKARKVLSVLLACLLLGQSVFGSTPKKDGNYTDHIQVKVDKLSSKTIAVGKVKKDKEMYSIKDQKVPTYTCENISYILLADLKQVGANVAWDSVASKAIIYDLDQPIPANPKFENLPDNATAHLGRNSAYINYQEVPALFVGGRTLIPAKWITLLTQGGEDNPFRIKKGSPRIIKEEKEIVEEKKIVEEIVDKEEPEAEDLVEEIEDLEKTDQIEDVEENIQEDIEEDIQEEDAQEVEEIIEEKPKTEIIEKEGVRSVKGVNIWYDGKNYIEQNYNFSQDEAEGYAFYRDKQYRLKTNYSYVGFVITEIDGKINTNAALHKAWLRNPTYFTIPAPKPSQSTNSLFPASIVQGTMKYSTNGFKKGEKVHVARASSGRSYHLINKNGKTVTVPWNSVTIHKTPVTNQAANKEQIEEFINSKNISSSTKYLIWTDIYRQRTYVFQGSKNNWKLIKNFQCITGKDITPTPRGLYTLTTRVPKFGSSTYQAKNAYGFIGTTYLYHSVLYNSTGKYLLTKNNTLGYKASNGCIRLSPADSIWLYNTMPSGTRVYIN